MYKFSGLLLTALLMLLVACGPTPGGITRVPLQTQTPNPLAKSTEPASKCTYLLKAPTPNPNDPSLFAPVTAQDHTFGPNDAYLTIVIYGDYQCTACADFVKALKTFQQKHPEDVRIVYRNFPLLTTNDKAAISTQAAEAAQLQGKFWEMHDLLFEKQAEWIKLKIGEFPAWVTEQAEGLGLDPVKFKADLTSPAIVDIPQKAWDAGLKIPLPGVPFLLVNGEIMKWQPTLLNNIETILSLNLLPKRQFDACPPMLIDPSKQYTATVKTAKGPIIVQLFADKAPNTVNNFVFLARQGWYDKLTFQRVVPGFIVQAGDPTATGQGNPGYFIPDEIVPTLKYDRPGVVGMFNNGPDTNGSQFFITFSAAAKLNGKYTIFGQVTEGIEVLNNLTPRDALPGETLPDGDMLISVTIDEK